MKIVNLHTIDHRNIGDLASTPCWYFPLDAEKVDAAGSPRPLDADVVVAGGGGLLHNDMLGRWVYANTQARWVSWGIGHNTHGGTDLRWPGWMAVFALHGVRDWGTQWPWVPCASCFHAAFDRPYEVRHEVVVYDHREYPTGIEGLPRMTNDCASAADVIGFLGSGETVVTSSYHGAYWGCLLGRRVLVVNPFSTKFWHFRHQPKIGAVENWVADRKAARAFPEALGECREANRQHFRRVSALIT